MDLITTYTLTKQYDLLLIYINLIMVILSVRDKVFTENEDVTINKILKTTLKDIVITILSLFLFIVALKGYQYSRQFHLIFAILLFVSVLTFRFSIFGILQLYNLKKHNKSMVVLCLNDDLTMYMDRFETITF